MTDKRTITEHRQKIEAAVHYIFKHLNGDLSLNKLSSVVNYSPFHFQKLFKEYTGETPKQYIIRMRLDTAAHYLIIHRDRSILEISIDCGFSSPAVFSRSFRKCFGITAEEMRSRHDSGELSMKQHPNRFNFSPLELPKNIASVPLKVTVKRMPGISGACINTIFEMKPIEQSLKEVIKTATAHDLLLPDSKILGIISPHHNIYRAFISVNPQSDVPHQLIKEEIKPGKYATFKAKGTPQEVLNVLFNDFYQGWLPQSGYKIADIFGFELFAERPMHHNYDTIEREIFIPIEPA